MAEIMTTEDMIEEIKDRIVNAISPEKNTTDTICFHAQQAVEKFFKGALIYFDKESVKTHDLVNLLSNLDEAKNTYRISLKIREIILNKVRL